VSGPSTVSLTRDALWLQVRSAINQAERVTGYGELDGLSKTLLEWIATRVGQGRGGLYVSEIIKHSDIASPATLSKLLVRLKGLGLISIVPDPNDRRCRLVGLTESSSELLNRLSAQLQGFLKRVT
jgi:DNA-binding MarR family transcriptional regulator